MDAQLRTRGRRAEALAAALALLFLGCTDFFGSGNSNTPPELVGAEPAGLSEDLSVLSSFTLSFSMPLSPTSLDMGIHLRDAGGRPVRARLTLSTASTVLLTPTDPLDFGEEYEILVTDSLRSIYGVFLTRPETLIFSTEGVPIPGIQGDSLLFHLQALAHDSMRGRGGGTEDELKAAQYLSERFLAYGLEESPGGILQSFQAESRKTGGVLSSRNILAVLPGKGSLVQEWVVVGAHYDALGFVPVGDGPSRIHNGADDNASGTALLLELARVFGNHLEGHGMAGRDRRSVLFAAFGAEEHGLLGSWHFVTRDPTIPLPQIGAMMNFDMVGRLRNSEVLLFGLDTSDQWEDLSANANVHGEAVTFVPWDTCSYCSDHAYFRDRAIPILWPYTLTHQEYHTPSDDVELLNVPGMVDIGDWASRVLGRLMVMGEPPAFNHQG